MLFGNDRNEMRRFFCDVWRKAHANEPLEPLERLIADIIQQHPEYQGLLTDADHALGREYLPEFGATNPFLHMGMHIAIQEQLGTQRPPGINAAYAALCRRLGDVHEAEHRMMEALGETLWEAQRNNTLPDEARYLDRLQRLAHP